MRLGRGGSKNSLSFDQSPGLPAKNFPQILFEQDSVLVDPDSAERMVLYWRWRSDLMVVVDLLLILHDVCSRTEIEEEDP